MIILGRFEWSQVNTLSDDKRVLHVRYVLCHKEKGSLQVFDRGVRGQV